MKQREQVAVVATRTAKGCDVQDYEFIEGSPSLDDGDAPTKTVRLSELFTAPDRSLVIYHFMYGKKQTDPCPMCTAWIDSFNGVAHHVAQNVDLAIVAAADPSTLRAHARNRGLGQIRLLSAGDSTLSTTRQRDREGQQTRRFQFSRATVMARCAIFYSVHPDWLPTSKSVASRVNPIWNVMGLDAAGTRQLVCVARVWDERESLKGDAMSQRLDYFRLRLIYQKRLFELSGALRKGALGKHSA